jgi:hypothetical protein
MIRLNFVILSDVFSVLGVFIEEERTVRFIPAAG